MGIQGGALTATLSAYEGASADPKKLIFSSGQELPPLLNASQKPVPTHWGSWTSEHELFLSYQTITDSTGISGPAPSFSLAYYIGSSVLFLSLLIEPGFCTDYNGEMDLPRLGSLWNRAGRMPYISTTYSADGTTHLLPH